jgi:hypothetical protein
MRNARKILVQKPEGKTEDTISVDTIKMDLEEIVWTGAV